jgi:hypothetical protein
VLPSIMTLATVSTIAYGSCDPQAAQAAEAGDLTGRRQDAGPRGSALIDCTLLKELGEKLTQRGLAAPLA